MIGLGDMYDLMDDDADLKVGFTYARELAEEYVRVERAAGFNRSCRPCRPANEAGDGDASCEKVYESGQARLYMVLNREKKVMAVFRHHLPAMEYSSACNDGGAGTSVEPKLLEYTADEVRAYDEAVARGEDPFAVERDRPAAPSEEHASDDGDETGWQKSVRWMLVALLAMLGYIMLHPNRYHF